MDSSPKSRAERNLLYRLCAVVSFLLGLFLVMGAHEHFDAVRPMLEREVTTSDGYYITLWIPVFVLVTTGLLNIGLVKALWAGKARSVDFALCVNGIAVAYLAYLLHSNVSGHPIGVFLALVSSHIIMLGAIRLGLVWPAVKTKSD